MEAINNGTERPRFFEYGPLAFDTLRDKAFIGRDELPLSENEFLILFLLVRSEGVYITFETVYDRIWDLPYYPDLFPNPEDYPAPPSRDEALIQMGRVVTKLNDVGKSAIKIEFTANKGYALRFPEVCSP
jgi:hypothetical protein